MKRFKKIRTKSQIVDALRKLDDFLANDLMFFTGETQKTDTCQGLGDYSFRIDEQKSISVNESYVLDESRKGTSIG